MAWCARDFITIMTMARFGWNQNEMEIDVFEFESIINIQHSTHWIIKKKKYPKNENADKWWSLFDAKIH